MKFTIVTPSYNQGQFIERTILSVLNQKDIDLEYLVFDGGSTDNTVSILEQYLDKLDWVSEKDNGQAHAVNKGIQVASGDIIGWLNSDDIYYPDALKKVKEAFDLNPNIDILYGQANHIDVNCHVIEQYPTQSWDYNQLKNFCFICQPAVFFRKKVFIQHGLLNEDLNFCMDYEYWLRLAKNNTPFWYVQDILAGSRLYATNKTLGSAEKVHYEINQMLKSIYHQVPIRWLRNYSVVKIRHINRHKQPLKFSFFLLFNILKANIHWNHRWSKDMFLDIIQLIKSR